MEVSFELIEQFLDHDCNPVFQTEIRIEGLPAGTGTGYSKKESQQNAAHMAIRKVKDTAFITSVNEAKTLRITPAQTEVILEIETPELEDKLPEEALTEPIQSKSPCDDPESPDRDPQ